MSTAFPLRTLILAALLGAGCASQSQVSSVTSTGESVSASTRSMTLGPPPAMVMLDCQPSLLATTVRFQRIPTVSELNDLALDNTLERVVLDLPAWPQGVAELLPIDQAGRELPIVAVLPGYPPSAAQADAWNQLRARVRIMVLVQGTPVDRTVVQWLNTMRGLERVVVWTSDPRGARIDRLAAPVSFVVQR
jgi:hypothetical protein